jgi:hypothetical protein
VKLTMTTLTAADAQPGDVVLAPDGNVYQAPAAGGAGGWSAMQMIGFYGDPAGTAPAGELILLVRDGSPQAAAQE